MSARLHVHARGCCVSAALYSPHQPRIVRLMYNPLLRDLVLPVLCVVSKQPPPCPSSSLPDAATVAAAHRRSMLARPMKDILECAPGADCRLGSANRFKVLGQKGITLWMTGLSGSGKTTIAEALERRLLMELGKNVYRIDGDNLRTGLTRDLGFSPDDRAESVRRASEVGGSHAHATLPPPVWKAIPHRGLPQRTAEAAAELWA
eukprot:597639-Pleurochrysis_carterae.AAC.5